MSRKHAYDSSFYDAQCGGSVRSAQIVVPSVVKMLNPKSVVDVGCGLGAWLMVFKQNGSEIILGIDGNHIDQSSLLIPREFFRAVDLSRPFRLEERFDLAVCLEVAEHLPKESADTFVECVCQVAPAILFSAAVPLQGGTHHVNEQWPEYWERLFLAKDYKMLDVIRPLIWKDRQIEWWYRQNIFLFVREELLLNNRMLREAAELDRELMLVHVTVLKKHVSLRSVVRRLPKMVVEAMYRKVKGILRVTKVAAKRWLRSGDGVAVLPFDDRRMYE